MPPDFYVFPGDFNPFHNGHIHALTRAAQYVSRIVVFVIEPSPERRPTINNFLLTLEQRRDLVQRSLTQSFIQDLEAVVQIDSGEEEFMPFYRRERPGLICGTDLFNYTHFPDTARVREYGWLLHRAAGGILVVQRPGYPLDEAIWQELEEAGINLQLLPGSSQVQGRDIRINLASSESIAGMVPADLEGEIRTFQVPQDK